MIAIVLRSLLLGAPRARGERFHIADFSFYIFLKIAVQYSDLTFSVILKLLFFFLFFFMKFCSMTKYHKYIYNVIRNSVCNVRTRAADREYSLHKSRI